MRTAIIGAGLLALGVVALFTGILPVPEAIALWERVWPILLFVVAMTIVTELAAEAGLFSWIAEHAARWAHGRTWVLWLIVVALAVVSTVFLSLDTTAVLLTPVVIVMARHVGVGVLPFAFTTVLLANTASLLLPVSNLTNLLAESHLATVSGHPVSPGGCCGRYCSSRAVCSSFSKPPTSSDWEPRWRRSPARGTPQGRCSNWPVSVPRARIWRATCRPISPSNRSPSPRFGSSRCSSASTSVRSSPPGRRWRPCCGMIVFGRWSSRSAGRGTCCWASWWPR